MKLSSFRARCYRSLRDETIELGDLNLFIGANASGKSTILDALRFLHEGVRARDFRGPMFSRGGILNLAWKGEEARRIDLTATLDDRGKTYEWTIRLVKEGYEFRVEENVDQLHSGRPPEKLLEANRGVGSWWSGDEGSVNLKQPPTSCALAAAAADASFPARGIAEFVERWGFFDPNPFLLRRDWTSVDSGRFDPYGRNLGETLYALNATSPEVLDKIVSSTREIVGLPSSIEPRESEDRFYFVQNEPGLQYPVNQMGVSSGTLRMLALMTALHGEPAANLIGIEEPENYIHPSALSSFVQYLLERREQVQIMVTTHSPLLLDYLGDPATVSVVRRSGNEGTTVARETDPDGVRRALEASGFGLGEFYETKGFGG